MGYTPTTGTGAVQRDTEARLVERAKQEHALVWYTSILPTHRFLAKVFQSRFPFLKMETLSMGGADIAERFCAEKQRGVEFADVLTSGLVEVYPDLRARSYVACLDRLPNWPAHPDWAKDPHGTYAYFHAMQHCMTYNTDTIAEEEAPISYAELTNPKWKNKVTLVGPDTGAMGVYLARFVSQHPKLGFDWMEKMRANGVHFSYQCEKVNEAVVSNLRPLALDLNPQAIDAQKAGAHVKYLLAKDGYPCQFMTVSVNKKAPHPWAARLFANWLLSEEVRMALQHEGFDVPEQNKADMVSRGAWILDIEGITPKETEAFRAQATRAFKGP